jgi:hypothetical protein
MGEDAAREAALDLAWSLWTELGVPGSSRNHRHVAVDPEVLVVATSWICRHDARLSDLAFSWCTDHASRLSGARLVSLMREALPDVQAEARAFVGELVFAGVRWGSVEPVPPSRPRARRTVDIPFERPALVRLRMRSLVGVGGRADVLVALLALNQWVSAGALHDVGLARRNVVKILGELADGGIVKVRTRGRALEFRLTRPGELAAVVDRGPGLLFPDWRAIFAWMRLACDLARIPADSATLRVEVARHLGTLKALAGTLDFEGVPSQVHDPRAVVDRVVDCARDFAAGCGPGMLERPVSP